MLVCLQRGTCMINKKRIITCSQLVVFIAGLYFLPATTKSDEGSSILNVVDLALEKSDHKRGPALHGPHDVNYWESYNQWMCFNPDQVQFESVGIKYDVWKQMPQATVSALGQVFEVSPSADLKFDTPKVLDQWLALLNGSKQICLYAAFLQSMDSNEGRLDSLWILNRIKTENGTWTVDDNTLNDNIQEEKNEPYGIESYSECHKSE